MDVRPFVVAALAVLALVGLAQAAEAQLETFLKPEDITSGFDKRSAVQGNLVAVTGLLVAVSFAAIAGVMSTVPVKKRILPIVTIFLSTYLLVLLMQTAMFNYNADDAGRQAVFSISPVLFNGVAAPSVYIGPLAIVLGAAMGLTSASAKLLDTQRRVDTPRGALRAYLGAFAIAIPFLSILIWGNLQVLMALPQNDTGASAYLLLLPLIMLSAVALLVMAGVKVWQLGVAARSGAKGLAAHDAWIALRRGEWAALGVLLAASVAASALAELQLPILEAGRVFGLTARSHAQVSAFVAIALLPAWYLQTPVLRVLRADATTQGRQEHRSLGLTITYLALMAGGLAAAGIATWLIEGVLWAWVWVALPVAIFSLIALRPSDGLLPAMMAATILWAIGNTVTGSFQLTADSAVAYETAPGMLALWRAAAVLLIAWAVARAARDKIGSMGRPFAWPLTAGMGAAVALIVFLELPFSAWVIFENGAEYVGIGTVVASQDAPVRLVIHLLTGVSAFFTGLAVTRLHRPEWFNRSTGPLPALEPVPDGQA